MKVRMRAIAHAIYFGVMPYWVYEQVKHYDCSYLQHLAINVRYAWRWITYQEDESDREFELKTNKNGREAREL